MSFWDIVWFIVISFAFVAYLMVIFAIIGDIVRDEESSGFVKALWFIALIFLPFLAACIYVIAKGNAMTERQVRSRQQLQREQDAYIREVAATVTPADQIARARTMLDSGAITQAEFEQLKVKALA